MSPWLEEKAHGAGVRSRPLVEPQLANEYPISVTLEETEHRLDLIRAKELLAALETAVARTEKDLAAARASGGYVTLILK